MTAPSPWSQLNTLAPSRGWYVATKKRDDGIEVEIGTAVAWLVRVAGADLDEAAAGVLGFMGESAAVAS